MSRHSRRSSSSSSTSSSSSSSSSTSSSSSSSSSSSRSTHRREKGRSRRKKSSSKEGRVREGRRREHSIDRKESRRNNELSGHKDKGRERRRDWRSKSPDNRKQRHRSKSQDSRRHRHRSKSLSRRERSRSRSKERDRKEYRSKEKDYKVKKSESPSLKDIPKKFSSDYRESSVEEFKRKNSTKKSDSKRDDYKESSVEEFKRKNSTKKSDSKRDDDDGKKKEKSKPQKVNDDAPSNDLLIPNNDLLIKENKSDFKNDVDKTQSLSPNKIEKVEEYEKEHTKSDKNKKKHKDHSKNEDYEHSEKKKKTTKSKRKHSSSPETNINEDKDKTDLEENLNYSKEKHPKESKSKRKGSISEEANIDELQKMKEQLQRELDLEREEEEKVSSTTQSKDSDKRKKYKKSKDEDEARQNHGKRKLESEDGTEDENTIQKAKQIKTSDTYWNKYADKLGIQIDDPKLGKRNRETEKSPKDGERKVKEAKIDSHSLNKPSGNELIKKPVLDPLSTRAGGAYIPPAKLKMMQEQITDKSSQAFQRLSWEALKKSINGLVNKINVSNIKILVRELFKENIIRGRGVLCRSLMQAQAFSPTFTHVYAALVAVINSKFPQIGELLLHRLVLQFRRGVKRNDKNSCMASCKFLAHLINQQVAHEVVALEILTMLLEKAKDIMDETPTGEKSRQSSVELSITFLKDCGMKLSELTPKGLMIIMETLRNILHEGKLDARYKYMIEVLMAIQKENFKDFPSVVDELDLVEEGEQFTHVIELDGKLTTDDILNVFKLDPNYEENEKKYQELKASILGESDDDEDDGDDDSGTEGDTEDSDSKDEESDNEEKKDEEGKPILDRTESNLIAFRRTVYLTIQSSLDVDECAHKLLKGEIKPGWEEELCNMIIDCCAQQRTYIKFYGLLAQRFCMINKIYQEPFENLFKDAFETCHRLEIEKLRNVAKLFAHLFFSDAISWEVMSCIHLNQDETTSSSRVFLKILFEELANFMGLCKLNERLREPTLSHAFEGLLPRDNPVNTRFAINFFTTIGLGGLTDDLREFLRSQPKPTAVVAPVPHTKKESGSSSSGTSSSSTTSSSDSSSNSSSSGSSSSSSSSSSDSESDSSSGSSSSNDSSSSSKDSSGGSSSNESSSSSSESSSSDESVSKERKSRKRKRPKLSSNSAREKGQKRKPKKREGKSLPSSESKKRKYDNHYSKRRTSKAQ